MPQNPLKCKYRKKGQCMHKLMLQAMHDGVCIYAPEDFNMCPCYETDGLTIEHYKEYLEKNKKGMVCLSDKVRVSNATILKWLEEDGGRCLCP